MIIPLLEEAVASRATLFDLPHEFAFRLFNGFYEGYPDLALDIYGRTLVIYNYADDPSKNQIIIQEVIAYLKSSLTWLRTGILKTRNSVIQEEKKGTLIFGDSPETKIKEHGVWHALDLTLNRDASFYLDTRHLRKWLI